MDDNIITGTPAEIRRAYEDAGFTNVSLRYEQVGARKYYWSGHWFRHLALAVRVAPLIPASSRRTPNGVRYLVGWGRWGTGTLSFNITVNGTIKEDTP